MLFQSTALLLKIHWFVFRMLRVIPEDKQYSLTNTEQIIDPTERSLAIELTRHEH